MVLLKQMGSRGEIVSAATSGGMLTEAVNLKIVLNPKSVVPDNGLIWIRTQTSLLLYTPYSH